MNATTQHAPDQAARTILLRNLGGLHLRPTVAVVSLAKAFPGQLIIRYGDRVADAKSIFDLMLLQAPAGAELSLEARGPGSHEVLGQIADYLNQDEAPRGESP